ncbi:MAG TPA: ADP-ribosylglycohydrolase family protein [Armatimonadota bacterium]|jgi:ADP-ribosylglycohydrolase
MIEHTREEINQRRDEGADMTAWAEEHQRLVSDGADAETWRAFYQRLYAEAEPAGNATEPSTLEAIRALRPEGPRRLPVDSSALADKILGAWQGRIAGCILGAVVEGKPRDYIDRYLAAAGRDDLTGFFPRLASLPDWADEAWLRSERIERSVAGGITHAVRDDDIDYTILGLHYLEKYGPRFTSDNVADEWLLLLPYAQIYTAERIAYKNLVNDLRPPHSATHENPYREWIGAQIRADAFGYVNAGRPEQAADMAFRDACISHTRNGIYGEMWSAAMIAAAFSVAEPREAIEIGLSEIPAGCRLADAGRKLLAWSEEYPDWKACWERAMREYGHLNWVHTINNALWVMVGLLYGRKDFGRTIAIAVRCGQDTDCNGATAGSVLGAMLGAGAIPQQWTAPFNNTVRSFVIGFDNSLITDLASRTLAQYKRVLDAGD